MTNIPEDIKKDLVSPDPTICLKAASELAGLFTEYETDRKPPSWEDVFTLLKEYDQINPGVADAFWWDVQFDCDDWKLARSWVLEILRHRARQGTKTTFPENAPFFMLPGNDLTFAAHEMFDEDPEILREFLALGYDDLVVMALSHNCLEPKIQKGLLNELASSNKKNLVEAGLLGLFNQFREIHPKALELGLIKKLKTRNKHQVLIVNFYLVEGRMGSIFVYLEKPDKFLTMTEFWDVFSEIMKDLKMGKELRRKEIITPEKFSIVPTLDGKIALSRFFENGYSATVFGNIQKNEISQLRVDLPSR